jgi:hypothetical protein
MRPGAFSCHPEGNDLSSCHLERSEAKSKDLWLSELRDSSAPLRFAWADKACCEKREKDS